MGIVGTGEDDIPGICGSGSSDTFHIFAANFAHGNFYGRVTNEDS